MTGRFYVGRSVRDRTPRTFESRLLGCILQHFPADLYPRVADIGGGQTCRVAGFLSNVGYKVTIIDPNAPKRGKLPRRVRAIREEFLVRHARKFDLLVGLAPCGGTLKMIRAGKRKPLVLWPCGCRRYWPDGRSVVRAAPAYFRAMGVEYRKQGNIFYTPRRSRRSTEGFVYLRRVK